MARLAIGRATLYLGDAREVVTRLRRQVDAIVTDPPYHLVYASRGGADRKASKKPGDARFATFSTGFMGQTWDGGDIAFRPETWAAIGEPLKPGGFLVAFGGTRTYHRMACAIEDAGFVVQDCLMWLYGNGFPKRRDMLKPGYEPIVLAYKPGGARMMQIDECRIPILDNTGVWGTSNATVNRRRMFNASPAMGDYRSEKHPAGRWPANVCHDGSEEVIEAFPDVGLSAGGYRGAGERKSGYGMKADLDKKPVGFGDSGTAARFFYCAKANKHDRAGSRHPTIKPQALMRWLVPLVTPPGGLVLDPFGGSGSTAQAAIATGRRVVLIEREQQWFNDAVRRLGGTALRAAA